MASRCAEPHFHKKGINAMFHVPEFHRIRNGVLASCSADGNNGAFLFEPPKTPRNTVLFVIASDGDGGGLSKVPWEHASVSTKKRCPYWDEMCFIKDLFWDDEDVVFQFHPAKSAYVNDHPYCLHLWRPIGIHIDVPPPIYVGHNTRKK